MGDSENGLDPRDWSAFRAAAHGLLDACIDRLETARQHPWQPVPANLDVTYALSGPDGAALPPLADPAALAGILAHQVLPYGTGNTHPCFWGWVHGTGLAEGLLTEMVTATMNSNLGGRDHGANRIERAVIDWARGVMGFPEGASGVLVTGTSQATVLALAAARVHALGTGVRARGHEGVRLTAYAGGGAHNAARKAMELLGLGHAALRAIPETETGMDTQALDRAIRADLEAGALPFAVIATAGSVDLGRYDDFPAVATVARAHGLWLHVDAAFGAWTRLAPQPWRQLSDGLDLADSIACDFHKWMYVPYDCGMILMRDEVAHRAAFAARPAYLAGQDTGLAGGEPWYCDYGIDLSRGNRALRVWAAIRSHGAEGLGAAIGRNCDLAMRMGEKVSQTDGLALAAPVQSNLCVFTADHRRTPEAQSRLNAAIAQRLQIDGTAVFSTTAIGGVTCLRAAIVNHRSRESDIDTAIAAVAATRDRIDAGA